MRVGNLFPCLRGSDLQKDVQPVNKKLPVVSIIEDALAAEKPAIKELEIQENEEACLERGGLWLQFAAAISGQYFNIFIYMTLSVFLNSSSYS